MQGAARAPCELSPGETLHTHLYSEVLTLMHLLQFRNRDPAIAGAAAGRGVRLLPGAEGAGHCGGRHGD